MNTTLRTSLVALLSLIPILVMTGCGAPTAGVANPAGTTSSSTGAAAPTVPNSLPDSVPDSGKTIQPPAESSTTTPESTEPSSQQPTSQEPSSQEPSSQEPTGPAVLPTDLSGEVHGYIRAVDVPQSQLTLDKIDWFTGAAARQACIEDGVPLEMGDNWCTGYYFRNVNPALRVVTVSSDAVIRTLEGNTLISSNLSTLADKAAIEPGNHLPYRLAVVNGAITEVIEIFQP